MSSNEIQSARTPERAGASGFEPLEVDSPMAKWKQPQSEAFIDQARQDYSFPNWQSGSEQSIYYNLNIPEFFNCSYVPPSDEFSRLERSIDPTVLDLTFTADDGSTTPPLREYLVGKRQVQAMMMAHQGKVVFEIFPGMNPTDSHIWMSAAKTTVGLLMAMLIDEGKVDPDKPVPTYVPELRGTHWEQATVKNVMNMASGLDIEESIANLLNPDTWIAHFFTAVFEGTGDWREMSKHAQPLEGEPAGTHFRYSGANTQTLVLATQHVTGMRWQDFFHERVWSKIGAKSPYLAGLCPDGSPAAAGIVASTPEDVLRFALSYTPSWHVVSEERIVSERLLQTIQSMGDPAAYVGSTEEGYGSAGSARSRSPTPHNGTTPSPTAQCSSTATWVRASTSILPEISAACTSVWPRTRTRSRESIILLAICELRRSTSPASSSQPSREWPTVHDLEVSTMRSWGDVDVARGNRLSR